LRIRRLSVSATITVPLASIATPQGKSNLAFVPVPSANPPVLPARVVTTFAVDIKRIFALSRSATTTLPLTSMATPEGPINEALVPVPSANPPIGLPASVVIVCAPPRASAAPTSSTRSAAPQGETDTKEGAATAPRAMLTLPSQKHTRRAVNQQRNQQRYSHAANIYLSR
jgi:hypothetical protein